jgi:hypothetical protein
MSCRAVTIILMPTSCVPSQNHTTEQKDRDFIYQQTKEADTTAKSHDSAGTHTDNAVLGELEESTSSPSKIHWAAVPAVFVNDTYFRIFDDRQRYVPGLDDTWVYLGTIESTVPGWESPTQNFQTNNESMIGAEIYHSSDGRIPIAESVWGDPLNKEIIGDSIIVVFEGQRLLYISDEAHSEAYEVMNAVVRPSLMVDGVIYSLMKSGGGSVLESYIYLGEITSAVPIDEYPTENLQVNRDNVIGMKAWRLPPGDVDDIIVLHTDSYFLYKHLPGTPVNP